jgi:excisionase family DNA binding protein
MAETNQFQALRRIARRKSVRLVSKGGEAVSVPQPVLDLLAEIARNMAAGKSVSIVSEHRELTTQKAANLLGVSRPYFVRLLNDGRLPFHMAGSHKRVYLADVLAYREQRDRNRRQALDELARDEAAAGTYDLVILPEGAQDE